MVVFERREVEVVDFNTPYRVSLSAVGRCEVVLGVKMEEVKDFKYLEQCYTNMERWKEK